MNREEVELKVVEYAKSVDWDFEDVYLYIGSKIKYSLYKSLTGFDTIDKAKHIFNKYKPKIDQEIKCGDPIKVSDDGLVWFSSYFYIGTTKRGEYACEDEDGLVMRYKKVRKNTVITRSEIAEKFGIPIDQL